MGHMGGPAPSRRQMQAPALTQTIRCTSNSMTCGRSLARRNVGQDHHRATPGELEELESGEAQDGRNRGPDDHALQVTRLVSSCR